MRRLAGLNAIVSPSRPWPSDIRKVAEAFAVSSRNSDSGVLAKSSVTPISRQAVAERHQEGGGGVCRVEPEQRFRCAREVIGDSDQLPGRVPGGITDIADAVA